MKYINFESVTVENFCGYTDKMKFEFENGKITLITGPNGVGKSTIFSAIPFALYGITQTGQRPDDVLNNKAGKNCKVECVFSIDNKKYMAVRTIKYKKIGSTALLYEHGNTKPITKGYRETTNLLENLLIPKDLFFNTVLFGQKVKTFFTDLPDSKQKEIFRKILQLDNYVLYQKNVNTKIENLKVELSKVQNLISTTESKITILENENKIQLIEEIDSKKKLIENLKWELDKLNIELTTEKENLNALKESELLLEYEKLSNKLISLDNDSDNLKTLLQSKINELKSKYDLELSKKKEEFLQIEKQKNQIKIDTINSITNTIREKIDVIQNDKLENLRTQYIKEKEIILKEKDEKITSVTQTLNEQIDNSLKEIDTITKKLNDIQVQQSKISTIIDFANTKIKEYKIAIENKTSICPTCFQPWEDTSHIQALIDNETEIIVKNSEILNSLNESHSSLYTEKNELQEKVNHLKIQLTENIESIKSEYDDKIEIFNKEFKDKANEYKNSVKELQDKINFETEQIEKTFVAEIQELNEDLISYKESLDESYQQKYDVLQNEYKENIEKIDLQYSETKEQLVNIKQQLAVVDSFKNRIKNIEMEISNTNYIEKSTKEKIIDLKEQLEKIKIQVKDLKDSIEEHNKEINDIKKKIKICTFWKVGFSSAGIPSMLIDESIPFMNNKISEYLEHMSNGRYTVTFDTLKETKKGEFRDKISINVYDSLTHSNSRINLSGGQTRLVDIATILTLSNLQEDIHKFRINILLFDEIFDALDDKNTVNVSNLLRKILTNDISINLITHRLIDQIEADNIYTFK